MKGGIVIAPGSEENNVEMLAINERLVITAVRQQELAEAANKSAEAALRAEQRLRDLVQALDAVICELDVRTGHPKFLSLRAEAFFGHPLDRWLSQPNFLAEIIHPSDRERATVLFPAFAQERQNYEYEMHYLIPNGVRAEPP